MRTTVLALCGVLLVASPAAAQQAITLPGGATALAETHGDWAVRCSVDNVGAHILCSVAQEQIDNASKQRLLAIEMQPRGDTVPTTLVLPFGLALQRGVNLSIDDATPLPNQPFRTCLPAGCLVSFDIQPDIVAALRSGSLFKIGAVADGGADTPFSISLNGLAGALDRAASLMR